MEVPQYKFRALCRGEWKYFGLFDGPAVALDMNTIGQFSGLVDKDGNAIYDGDILKVRDRPRTLTGLGSKGERTSGWGDWQERLVEVYSEPGMWLVRHLPKRSYNGHLVTILAHAQDSGGAVEVIGNIHQHRHLVDNQH